MATLILRNADGIELGRREMDALERYGLYRLCCDHELLTFGHARYVVRGVTWRVPEEECIASVAFDSWKPSETPYEC